jgi:hypothetical protein
MSEMVQITYELFRYWVRYGQNWGKEEKSRSQSQMWQCFSEAYLLSYFTEYCNFRYDKLFKKDEYNKIWEETVVGCVNPMKFEFRLNNI